MTALDVEFAGGTGDMLDPADVGPMGRLDPVGRVGDVVVAEFLGLLVVDLAEFVVLAVLVRSCVTIRPVVTVLIRASSLLLT